MLTQKARSKNLRRLRRPWPRVTHDCKAGYTVDWELSKKYPSFQNTHSKKEPLAQKWREKDLCWKTLRTNFSVKGCSMPWRFFDANWFFTTRTNVFIPVHRNSKVSSGNGFRVTVTIEHFIFLTLFAMGSKTGALTGLNLHFSPYGADYRLKMPQDAIKARNVNTKGKV